jgi:hypothetical protein
LPERNGLNYPLSRCAYPAGKGIPLLPAGAIKSLSESMCGRVSISGWLLRKRFRRGKHDRGR